jgi:5'-nucleotidase
VKALCQKCSVPIYELLDDEKLYKVAMPDFLANGGDGFSSFPENTRSRVEGRIDIDVLEEYIQKFSPLNLPPLLGRSSFL